MPRIIGSERCELEETALMFDREFTAGLLADSHVSAKLGA
jgi:hypothetical protein